MLGLTQYFLRLRAAGVALMPSVAVALGLMGVSGATADDGARNPGSRTGTVLRYRVDAAQVRSRWLQSIQTDVRRFSKNGNIGHDGAVLAGDQIRVTLRDPGKMDEAVQRLKTFAASSLHPFATSSDLTVKGSDNGLVVVEPTPEWLSRQEERALAHSIIAVRGRIFPDAGKDVDVLADGKDGILVRFVGLDAGEVKARISSQVKLTFQLLDDAMPLEEARANGVPAEDELVPDAKDPDKFLLLHKEAVIGNSDFWEAGAALEPVRAKPCIHFLLTEGGTEEFARSTRGNIGKRFAIVLDSKVLSTLVIRSEIPSGRGEITGISSLEEAVRVAFQLGSGALPAPLLFVEERTIELTARRRE